MTDDEKGGGELTEIWQLLLPPILMVVAVLEAAVVAAVAVADMSMAIRRAEDWREELDWRMKASCTW